MGDFIKDLIDKIVKKYGTRNPFELAKILGIEVQIGNPGCAGCYMYLKKHRYIFLDQTLNECEKMQVMAHELGHAILHKKQNCYFIRNKTLLLNTKTEREANLFAAELLIENTLFLDHQDFTLSQLARLSGYDEKLIELRLKNTEINSIAVN